MLLFYTIKNKIGKVPLCNGKSDRALHIFGFCFPLCYRCMTTTFTLLVLSIASKTILDISYIDKYKLVYIVPISVILIIPMLIDSILQYFFYRISTNTRRVITAFLFSVGIFLLVSYL